MLRRWWSVLCLCECGSPSSATACDGLSEVVVSNVFIVIHSFGGCDARKDGAFPHILGLIELFRTMSIALHEQVSKLEIRSGRAIALFVVGGRLYNRNWPVPIV